MEALNPLWIGVTKEQPRNPTSTALSTAINADEFITKASVLHRKTAIAIEYYDGNRRKKMYNINPCLHKRKARRKLLNQRLHPPINSTLETMVTRKDHRTNEIGGLEMFQIKSVNTNIYPKFRN